MKKKHEILSIISLSFGVEVALAFVSGCSQNTSAGDQMKPMTSAERQKMLPK